MPLEDENPVRSGEISLADAQGSLLGGDSAKASTKDQPAAKPSEQATEATEAPADEPDEEAAAETPSGDDDTPETTDLDEPDDDLPAIDPPASWKQMDRDRFSELPRDVQQTIADRERSREIATNRTLQEAAEQRKALDAELQQAASQRQLYQQQLDQLVPALRAGLNNEFPDIRTPADVQKLAREDPDRYAQWDAGQKSLQMAYAEQQQQAEQAQREQAKAQSEYLAKAEQRLVEAFPEWTDTDRGRREISDMQAYLSDEYNVPKDLLAQMVEPWHYKLVAKARKYDQAQRAKAKAVSQNVPKVQKPGNASSKADRAAEGMTASLKRLEKTGDIEDALALMRQR